MRTPRGHGLLATVVAALALATATIEPAVASERGDVIEQRVVFRVVNRNTSDIPCEADGEAYDVHGVLTAPRRVLNGSGGRSITFYLHGFSAGGKYLWTFDVGEQ